MESINCEKLWALHFPIRNPFAPGDKHAHCKHGLLKQIICGAHCFSPPTFGCPLPVFSGLSRVCNLKHSIQHHGQH